MNKYLLSIITLGVMFTTHAQVYQGAHTFGVAQTDLAQTSAIDSQGNVYSAGFIGGALAFGPDNIGFRGGNADGYLAKYDAMGNPVWIKPFASGFDDVVTAITISDNEEIFLTGYFQGAGTQSFDADPGSGVFLLSQPAAILSRDCFIIKLDNNGDFIWAKQVSNPSGAALQEDSFDIELDSQGNVYIAGRFQFADFDPGSGTNTVQSTSGSFEGFLLKLNTNGDFVWVNHIKNSSNAIRDIVVDSDDNIIAFGEFDGTIDVSATSSSAVNLTSVGANDVYVVKYDAMGNYGWSRTISGSQNITASISKVNANNDILIGGSYNGTIDVNPSPSTTESITASGASNGYVVWLNTNGNYVNHYDLNGTSPVQDIDLTYSGKVVITGGFSSVVDFDNSTNTANTNSQGNVNAYILSIDPVNFTYDSHLSFGDFGNPKNNHVVYNPTLDRFSFTGGFFSTVDFNPFAGIDNKTSQGSEDIYLMQLDGDVLSNDTNLVDYSISMYPNPANGFVNISSTTQLISATIIDVNGRLLSQINLGANVTNQQINISNLNTGVYFVTIKSDLGTRVERLIVE